MTAENTEDGYALFGGGSHYSGGELQIRGVGSQIW